MQILCPHCNSLLDAEEETAGINVECPICHNMFVVPFVAKVVPTEQKVVPLNTPQNNQKEDSSSDSRTTRTHYWVVTIILLIWSYFFSPLDFYSIFHVIIFAVYTVYWYMVFDGRLKDINVSEGWDKNFWSKLIFVSLIGEFRLFLLLLTGEFLDPLRVEGKLRVFLYIADWAPLVCLLLSFIVGFIDGTVGENRYGADPRKRK